jgi:hypothetical protein
VERSGTLKLTILPEPILSNWWERNLEIERRVIYFLSPSVIYDLFLDLMT